MIRLSDGELKLPCYDIVGECELQNKWRAKQAEETMSDKIQMTEEQADILLDDMGIKDSTYREHHKEMLRDSGYIIKSELQQKVEEWELIIHDSRIDYSGEYRRNIMLANEIIELFKKDHPEFKK